MTTLTAPVMKVAPPPAPRRRRPRATGKFWIAVAPALLIFGIFTLIPMLNVVYYSFTKYNGFAGVPEWIGLDNYIRILSGDPAINEALVHTGIYAFFYVVVQLVIAFLLAVLLERAIRGAAFYRAAFFLPVVISSVAVAYTWSFMYDPTNGAINSLLRSIGLGALAQDWLGNYDLALLSVIAVDLWRNIGFSIVIFIAGLGTIPQEVSEAARIDGAGRWATLRYITVPLMRPTIGLVTVLAVNGALRAFDTVYLMTGGGPGTQTVLYMTLAFDKAFVNRQFGLSSAMSILVLLLLIPIAIMQSRLGNEGDASAEEAAGPMTATTPSRTDTVRGRATRRLIRRLPLQVFLIVASLVMLAPVVLMVGTSLKPNSEVLTNPIGLPANPTFDNYVTSWVEGNFATLFVNSIILTLASMIIATFASALAAYAIARATTRGSALVYVTIAIGIFLPMQLALIPQFRLIRDLGLFNSYLGVILIYVAGSIPFGVFLMTAFMRQVPHEIVEAGTLDGAGYFTMFWRVFFPLARPAIATFWILQGVQIWNEYLVPLLLMTDPNRRTLTTGVIAFRQIYLAQWGNIMAGVVIMSLPIIVIFIVLQRQFLRGIYSGAVK